MNAQLWTLALLLLPVAAATEPTIAYSVSNVRAVAQNQRVDLTWDPVVAPDASGPQVVGYVVLVFEVSDAALRQETNGTQASFFGVNGRTYTFQVAARLSDGTEGPRSGPVAATPHLARDLAYLASGLVATWVAILGYVGLLARREARLDRKLEQLLVHRGGRNP
jgi:CcmD family protein